jgi:hypothetical protein
LGNGQNGAGVEKEVQGSSEGNSSSDRGSAGS